jgi:hypothetical protein
MHSDCCDNRLEDGDCIHNAKMVKLELLQAVNKHHDKYMMGQKYLTVLSVFNN